MGMMAKVYGLAIKPRFEFESGATTPMEYYSKGHHTPAEFCAALKEYGGWDVPESLVLQSYERIVPVPGLNSSISSPRVRAVGVHTLSPS